MSMDIFNGIFGKIAPGMCRISLNGEIAVKTSSGYKSYNIANGRLTNCSSFVFDVGEDFFFLIPANKVTPGDIILVGGKPKCVIESEKDKIAVVSYEDSSIENIIPERHVFMGNAYFFGKIVSMFGSDLFKKGEKSINKIMRFMMLSQCFKGSSQPQGMNPLLVMALAGGGNMNNLFDGIFDTDDLDGEDE